MDRTARLEELLLQWEEEFDKGTQLTAEQLCRDCPELQTELMMRIKALHSMRICLGETPSRKQSKIDRPTIDHIPESHDSRSFHGDSTTDGTPGTTIGLAGDAPPQIGRYTIDRKLGEGGMGVVYRGRDRDLNRFLAVKVIKAGRQSDVDACRRFLEEAQVMGQLQHPGIAPIHEIGNASDGRPFFSMKQVQGHTLAELLKKRRDAMDDLLRFIGIYEQICQTLAYAHSQSFIHRDLKPANVMVGAFGEVQVMDWGLAKRMKDEVGRMKEDKDEIHPSSIILHPSETQHGVVVGTPAYMAPEQACGNIAEVDQRADVFGLGAVLCEILTGMPAYQGVSVMELLEQATAGNVTDAYSRLDACGADAELIELCKRCLALQKDDRPRTAAAVAEALSDYQTQVQERTRQAERERAAAQARAEEAQATAEAERRARRLTLGLALTGLLLVVAGGAIGWVVYQQRTAAIARREQADGKARDRMAQARHLLEAGWQGFDLTKLARAQDHANRAVEIAAAAGAEVRTEAGLLLTEVKARLDAAEKHSALLAGLLDVHDPKETKSYATNLDGTVMELAEPSADEQFTGVFRRWGINIDQAPFEELLPKFQKLPEPVRLEVVAGLEQWAVLRRGNKRPDAEWRRLYDLADQLDDNPQRRELHRLRFSGVIRDHKAKLRKLAGDMDPLREPVLGVVSLALTLAAAEEMQAAEEVLRSALAARPNEVILLDRLGKLLAQQKPPQLAEAIECYRAARALRPQMGIALAKLLAKADRKTEAEQLHRDLIRRQPTNPEMHFYFGYALAERKKWDDAIAAYNDALNLSPNMVDAHDSLGIALAEKKDMNSAFAAFQKALAIDPNSAATHNNVGAVYYAKMDMEGAIAACEKALALDPKLASAHNNLGAALFRKKDWDGAIDAYQNAIALDPNMASAHSNLCAALSERKDVDGAFAAIQKALAIEPDNPAARTNLGNVLHDKKDLDGAIDAYHKAIAIEPNYVKAHYNLGIALRDKKDFDGAIGAFQKAIDLEPNWASAHNNLGNALRDKKDLDGAIAAFKKAIALDSNVAMHHFNLGVALVDKKEIYGAIEAFQKAIAVDPNYADAHYNLGNSLVEKKDADAAVAAYLKAIALKPNWAQAHSALGNALVDKKDLAGAIAAYRKAIALDQSHAATHFNLGNALRAKKDVDGAIAAYRQAIAIDPNLAQPYNNLANALREKQDLDGAIAALKKAVALEPKWALVHNNLADALRARMDYDGAIAAFQKAIALQPSLAQSHIGLGFAFRDQGRFAEAARSLQRAISWLPAGHPLQRPAQSALRNCQQLRALEKKLPAQLNNPQAGAAELRQLADLCQRYLKRYRDATKLYAAAFAAEPRLADDLRYQHRYNAACAAAVAAVGKGKDAAEIKGEETAKLRQQASAWLRADLDTYAKLLKQQPPAAVMIQRRLQQWQIDADLAGLRDAEPLAKLPQAERKSWQTFWSEVTALRKQARSSYVETKLKGELTDAKRQRTHKVKLTEGNVYFIEMHSSQFDTYLKLQDAKGRIIAENDDIDYKGKNLNSRLMFSPTSSGVYHLLAGSYQRAGRGHYEIIIRGLIKSNGAND